MLRKQQIIEALRKWINQRPGLEFGNYGDWAAYRSELRSIARDRRDALELLQAVTWRDGITAERLLEGFRAYSGRLKIESRYSVNGKGAFRTIEEAEIVAGKYLPSIVGVREFAVLDYCVGQYWPTEYRRAACAVLASALWDHARDDRSPSDGTLRQIKQSKGDWLREHFRREFGRGIASRWFN